MTRAACFASVYPTAGGGGNSRLALDTPLIMPGKRVISMTVYHGLNASMQREHRLRVECRPTPVQGKAEPAGRETWTEVLNGAGRTSAAALSCRLSWWVEFGAGGDGWSLPLVI